MTDIEQHDMEWPGVFYMNTGRQLTKPEADLWYRELQEQDIRDFRENIDSENDKTICNAIRSYYSTDNQARTKYKPKRRFDLTKNDLRIWICIWKGKSAVNEQTDKERDREALRQQLRYLKDQIARETDPIKLWDLICTPEEEDGWKAPIYKHLEDYVRHCHPEWERPTAHIAKLLSELVDAASGVASSIKCVEGDII